MSIWVSAISSVVLVSLISLVGIFTLIIKMEKLKKVLLYFVSLSAGTMLGGAFFHLVPEAFSASKNSLYASSFILVGIIIFFLMEKIIHWRHCHQVACKEHPHPFSYMILIGDSLHNFVDGMVIAASFLISFPLGVATTLAVVFHEIPQEIGDFGSLVYGGFSRVQALAFNFLTALFAVLGAVSVLVLSLNVESLTTFLIPFAAGGFIYIASSDLIPEIKKSPSLKENLSQAVIFILGISIMIAIAFIE